MILIKIFVKEENPQVGLIFLERKPSSCNKYQKGRNLPIVVTLSFSHLIDFKNQEIFIKLILMLEGIDISDGHFRKKILKIVNYDYCKCII